MKDLILVGGGDCMREFAWQLDKEEWKIIGYVDVNENKNIKEYRYLGSDDYLLELEEEICVGICIAFPPIRKNLYEKLKVNKNLKFPVIIARGTNIADSADIGKGSLISMGSFISCNTNIGDFVFVNTNVTISHDGNIGNFVTLSPRVTLAGRVSVGELTGIGMGTDVIQGVKIGTGCMIGAGAAVVKNIPDALKAVGVPARVI